MSKEKIYQKNNLIYVRCIAREKHPLKQSKNTAYLEMERQVLQQRKKYGFQTPIQVAKIRT